LHGADAEPCHVSGALFHVDVNNYYPSMLIAWGLVTRAATNDNYTKVYMTRKQMKFKQTHAETKDEAKRWKKAQLPYKKMLNALSGAMKDKTNPAYDPRNNNCMCINGQLMLLDLIEHLEQIPGFRLIQSNTDGLIVWIPNTDEAFNMLDDICYEWEERCSTDLCEIKLELDCLKEIYQKDVNNYLWVDLDGGVERIGAYVKELSRIDNDLPILNKALVEYMVHKTPVEQTINECDELIQFQKIVKLSDNYKWVEHEHSDHPVQRSKGVRVIKTWYEYPETVRYTYKSYRVFASKDIRDGRLLKNGGKRGKPEKFGNTPEHCFIFNDSVEGVSVPDSLDREWYIDFAKKRLKDLGVQV
jgi:DNA polymerase